MQRIVNDIRKVIVRKQDILFEQLNFGACEASLHTFKSKIGLELPEIFYDFYAVFNGSVDEALPIWGRMRLLPLSKIIQEKEILDNKIKSNWNLNWVPFLMENQFSFICIKLDKESDSKNGSIIQYNSNKSFQVSLFTSFAHWLEAFYHIIANFDKDIVVDNSLYRSYFNTKIASLLQ